MWASTSRQAQQYHWESVGAAFQAIVTVHNALGCVTTFGIGPATAICLHLTTERCVPLSYNDGVLGGGNRIIQRISAAEAHKYSDIVADPPDPNYQRFATVTADGERAMASVYRGRTCRRRPGLGCRAGGQSRAEVEDADTAADQLIVTWWVDGQASGEGASVVLGPGDAAPPATLEVRVSDGDPLMRDAVAYWAIAEPGVLVDPDPDPDPDPGAEVADEADPEGEVDPDEDPTGDGNPIAGTDGSGPAPDGGGGGVGGSFGGRGQRAGGCQCEVRPGEASPGWYVTLLRSAPPRR